MKYMVLFINGIPSSTKRLLMICQFMHSSYIFNEKYLDTVETLLDEFLERADLIMLSICLDVFDICADPAL
jgi:hypothetical protein